MNIWRLTVALLLLFSGSALAAVAPPTSRDVVVAFSDLEPALAYGDLVLLQRGTGTLAQVTVLSVLNGDADALKALVADPLNNKQLSSAVKEVRVTERKGDVVRYTSVMDTPAGSATMHSVMKTGPGRDLYISSTGGVAGEFAWRFTPLPGGRTGVEHGLLIDMKEMGSFVSSVFKKTPGLKVGINAAAGLMWMDGLRRLSTTRLGVKQRGDARALPGLANLPGADGVMKALSELVRHGQVAWVGDRETMLMGLRPESPSEVRQKMSAPAGRYEMTMETPLRDVHVKVDQRFEQGNLLETIDGGESIDGRWQWRFEPIEYGTLLTMRTSMDPGKLWIMKLVLSIDPSVAPAVRLSAALNPWVRANL